MVSSDVGIRPCPLLMHMSAPDTEPQLLFWNALRQRLPGLVRVHYFDSIDQAGPLIVIPHDAKEWTWQESPLELRSEIRRFLASGRTVVTFATGIEYQAQAGEIVFASSVYQTSGEQNIPLPSWLYDIGSLITPIPKPVRPTVTFRGNTKYSGRISSVLGSLPVPDAWVYGAASSRHANRSLPLRFRFGIARLLRQRVLRTVRKADNLDLDLVEMGNYFSFSDQEKLATKADYVKSIQQHAYVLCMRGDTNGDYRTFEVMSAGRIPVIIDTKLRFPELKGMAWSDFAVIVPLSEMNNIGQLIEDFHGRLTENTFRQKCRLSRQAFSQLLPEHYIDFIIREIRNRAIHSDKLKKPAAGQKTVSSARQPAVF